MVDEIDGDGPVPGEDTPPEEDEGTAFPAAEGVPGQAESRGAYGRFRVMLQVQMVVHEAEETQRQNADQIDWWQEYLALRAEGWDWRKAAFIAWASSPTDRRWPATQDELARKVLGLKSDRVISKWRLEDENIQKCIEAMQVAPLMAHRRDVIEAMIAVAKRHDPAAFQDRRMMLEILKIYQPKGQMALTGEDGGPVDVVQIYIPDNGRKNVVAGKDGGGQGANGQPD